MKRRTQHPEAGVALLICLFALLLVSAIGAALVFSAQTETSINDNYRNNESLYFGAKSGLEEARVRLTASSNPLTKPTALPQNSNSQVLYLLNPGVSGGTAETINPWSSAGSNPFFDDQLCHAEFSGLGLTDSGTGVRCGSIVSGSAWYQTANSIDPNSSTSKASPWKWVRISLKNNNHNYPFRVDSTSTVNDRPICWDGSKQLVMPSSLTSCDQTISSGYKPVYVLTAKAVRNLGNSTANKYVQMEVAQDPPPHITSAVDAHDNVVLNGQLTVDGYDNCSCSCVESGSGSNTTYTCTNRSGNTCDRSKYAIYASGNVDNPTASENLYAGTTPAVAEDMPPDQDITALIAKYSTTSSVVNVTSSSSYNWSCPADTSGIRQCGTKSATGAGTFGTVPVDSQLPGTPGQTIGTPQTTYIPGNVQLTGGWQGNGMLIVNGDLDIHGGLNFYGIILVKGVVKFTGGGSDATNITGAIIAGQESYVDNVLGGSATIRYNSCAVSQSVGSSSPRMLSIRELAY